MGVGGGGFGTVYRGLLDGISVAVKVRHQARKCLPPDMHSRLQRGPQLRWCLCARECSVRLLTNHDHCGALSSIDCAQWHKCKPPLLSLFRWWIALQMLCKAWESSPRY